MLIDDEAIEERNSTTFYWGGSRILKVTEDGSIEWLNDIIEYGSLIEPDWAEVYGKILIKASALAAARRESV